MAGAAVVLMSDSFGGGRACVRVEVVIVTVFRFFFPLFLFPFLVGEDEDGKVGARSDDIRVDIRVATTAGSTNTKPTDIDGMGWAPTITV